MKVLSIVGTRPELIKMCLLLRKCDTFFKHVFVHTGQNFDFELNEIFYQDLNIRKPDYFLASAGKTAVETIANTLLKFDEVLATEKPDAIVVYGDTNSCLAAIAAKKRKIPIFHIEAGNRCFDQRVPEEVNRKIIDHISDINMVHSEMARHYLVREGLPSERIFKTGSPMVEIKNTFMEKILQSKILQTHNLKPKEYFVVSVHREENVDSEAGFEQTIRNLNQVAQTYPGKTVIVSTHPRTRNRLADWKGQQPSKNITFLKPLGFFDYLYLQIHSFCVLSDSGTLTEESSIFNFNGVMIRQAHERPEGVDVGTSIMSGWEAENLLKAIEIATQDTRPSESKIPADYANAHFSETAVRIILSYTDYVNRVVWRKSL